MNKKLVNLVVFFVILLSLNGCSSEELNVKEEKVTVEYGKEISVNAEDYLSNDEEVLSKVEVLSDIENEEGKDYPAIGDYNLTFKYEKQEAEIKVSVVDTTNPSFVDFKDTVETYQNSKVNFENIYSAEDLSHVTITYDDSGVDYSTSGTYEASITATDSSGNTDTKEAAVHVIEVMVQMDKTSVSIYKGETVQLAATTNIPEIKAVFISSDDTVATVDENGLVTAVKSGKAVITAEAKGVKAECEVSVSEKPNTSKPATNTSTSQPATNTGTTNKNSDKDTAASGSANTGTNNNSGDNASSSEENRFENVVPETSTPQTSKEAFDLINEERIKLGLEPAVWDAECERIALIRGAELAELDRVTEENAHEGFFKFQNENHKLCECVAWGCGNAATAVTRWMYSPGHKDIIMDPKYTKLAVVQVDGRWVAVNSR